MFDETDAAEVWRETRMVPGAMVAGLPDAGHQTPWDAPVQSGEVVRGFLRSVDRPERR